MTKFNSGKASILALTSAFAVAAFFLGKSFTLILASPAGDVPKAYCHAAGLTGTTHFNYHYNKAWTAHFYDNGSPKAGHEDDFYTLIGDRDCDGQVDSTPTPTPTDCDGDCPTATPEPTDDVCPNIEGVQDSVPEGYFVNNDDNCVEGEEPTPEPTPTPNPDVCANIDGVQTGVPSGLHMDAGNVNCVSFSDSNPPEVPYTPQGQVLGASTMAGTGSFAENLYMGIMGVGAILTLKGAKNFKKAFKKA
ncbi:MAG: hypothetical protein UU16_C0006G0026 [Candidatus Woesebacteria bacterium GW2011_GWA2_40_7]|uniref:Uncharacterized protein n=3 Tax=Candidatus Woeseibacteriota TaxID=1752722 RepID=A0A0G0UV40_9BACT|nr:MAG: hypothetical protein UT17_C0002G0091 [Candidatus Woesebacteria bacterium GW2011_GWB1_39_10]KKR74072.1 MAG: hypothetical protein UU16_C0006G0026 [Candidatus Woesebacteria bacterium GW2011_GWA2_40_7]KKR92558.1 MAG: hypothetical protein UU42_C0001G0162 [Candidatus Woesebacteria bacterium GW2011_GWA1_41_13b]